jgi:hypothetical protein
MSAIWTRERIAEAVRSWAETHDGEPPAAKDWTGSGPEWPSPPTVRRAYGSWRGGIEAAGIEPRRRGRPAGPRDPDDRQEVLTIRMTREEWDVVAGRRYPSWETQARARAAFEAAVKPGLDARRDAARSEAVALLPRLTEDVKQEFSETLARLVREFRAGTLKVDHLGAPSTIVGGYRIAMVPRTVSGDHAVNVAHARPVYFDGKEIPMDESEREWFVGTVRAVTGSRRDPWSGGTWVTTPWR